MLVFKCEVRVIAQMEEDMKEIFMSNCEDVIQQGLNRMTVPDWRVTVVDVIEEDD